MTEFNCPHADASGRLMCIAEQLFVEKGYRATSVREITQQAECNIAAVNYHFGSKEKLYQAVFMNLLSRLRQHRLDAIEKIMQSPASELTLEKVLTAFSEAFLEPMLDESHSRRLMQLMMRENLDPHMPPGTFATEILNPISRALASAMSKVAPTVSPDNIRLCILSLIGQLFQVVHVYTHAHNRTPEMTENTNLSQIIEHIVRFTAAGIRNYSQENNS